MIFFFNDTATTEIYTLSLHDALPISEDADPARLGVDPDVDVLLAGDSPVGRLDAVLDGPDELLPGDLLLGVQDRKSTRLNSSHANISYAVFCLKKKKILQDSVYSK